MLFRSYEELLKLVDQDTDAFNLVMEAFKLPKGSDKEVIARKNAIQSATLKAMEVPYRVMQSAYNSMNLIEEMAVQGNPSSITDAGVGALCAAAAVSGAYLNVLVNAAGIENKGAIRELLDEAEKLESRSRERCATIQNIILSKLKK